MNCFDNSHDHRGHEFPTSPPPTNLPRSSSKSAPKAAQATNSLAPRRPPQQAATTVHKMAYELTVQTKSVPGVDAAAEFRFGDESTQLVTITADLPLAQDGTPWLAPSTVIAMKTGASVRIASVDGAALENAEKAQAVLAAWFGDLRPVHVHAAATGPRPAGVGVGCFFSGGVDSFFSALRHSKDITHLIFVRGFDIDFMDDDLGERAAAATRAAATAMGKEFVEVRTDIRQMSDPRASWGTQFHGAALAMVGLALAPHLSRVIVPASYHKDDLYPWGSHPALDKLWSSSSVTFDHDGTDATRPEKVAFIARYQVALDHLRVCWINRDGAYNCGRCEKCLRTMINLQSLGALSSCATLPHNLDLGAVKHMHLDHSGRVFAEENLRALRGSGRDEHELERALQRAIRIGRASSLPGIGRTRSLAGRLKRFVSL